MRNKIQVILIVLICLLVNGCATASLQKHLHSLSEKQLSLEKTFSYPAPKVFESAVDTCNEMKLTILKAENNEIFARPHLATQMSKMLLRQLIAGPFANPGYSVIGIFIKEADGSTKVSVAQDEQFLCVFKDKDYRSIILNKIESILAGRKPVIREQQ